MVSQKKGNPSELISLAAEVQRGLGETGNTPVFISHYFIARLRAVINVSQISNRMTVFLGSRGVCARREKSKIRSFFLFFLAVL